jgi:hypothetical protein
MKLIELVAFNLATLLAGARGARLLIHDEWPPTARLRTWYLNRTGTSPWSVLFTCHYCMAPWTVLAAWLPGWFVFDLWAQTADRWGPWGAAWWFTCGWLSLAYLAATYVSYDGSD